MGHACRSLVSPGRRVGNRRRRRIPRPLDVRLGRRSIASCRARTSMLRRDLATSLPMWSKRPLPAVPSASSRSQSPRTCLAAALISTPTPTPLFALRPAGCAVRSNSTTSRRGAKTRSSYRFPKGVCPAYSAPHQGGNRCAACLGQAQAHLPRGRGGARPGKRGIRGHVAALAQ